MLIAAQVSTWSPAFLAAIREHYTHSRGAPVGKKAAWRIFWGEHHVGWFGLGEPAYKLAARRALGLDDGRPLPLTVSNFIYRLDGLRGFREVNASRILRELLPVFMAGWAIRYGWEPVHIETLVDPAEVGQGNPGHVAGYCFRRAGFRAIGMTTGRTARRPPGSTHGARVWSNSTPKLVLYKGPLHRVGS